MSSGIPDAEGSSTVVKLPTYKGVPAGYQKFRLRFSAYCNAKGFAIGLRPQAVNMPTSETDVTDTDPLVAASKLAYVKANANAVSAYTLALEGDQVFQMVMSATTADWPNGLAHLITDKLEAQYQPHDLVAEIELDAKMQSIIMETNASPLLLFNQIAALQLGYSAPGRVIPDSKFYPLIIRVAPHQYDDVIQTALEAGTVSLDSIQTAMMKKYRFIIAKNPKLGVAPAIRSPFEGKSPNETGLMDVPDIICYKCRAEGHKANDPNCPLKSKPYAGSAGRNGSQGGRGNGKFRGECNHCGMRGHKASDCFEKSENAGRRPRNWKSKMTGVANGAAINDDYTPSELNAVAIDVDWSSCRSCDREIDRSEVGLMAVMPSQPTLALLNDPNIFVGDNGATCDSTASDYGMYDCIESVTNADSRIMSDKKSTEALNITVVPINSLDFEVGEDDTADAESVTSVIENEEPDDEDESQEVPIAEDAPISAVITRNGRVSVTPQRLLKVFKLLHIKAMHRAMAYIVSYPSRGYVLNPKRRWNSKPDSIEFEISEEADSEYTRHVKLSLLHEMKEVGIIKTVWCPRWDNPADMFTKNLAGKVSKYREFLDDPDFNKYRETLFGKDEY